MNQEPQIEISTEITDFLHKYSTVIDSLQKGENIDPEILNRALGELSQLSGFNIASIEAISPETPTVLDVTLILYNENIYQDRELNLKLTLSKQGLELAKDTITTFQEANSIRTLNRFLKNQGIGRKSFDELSKTLSSCTIYQPKDPEDQIVVVSTWPEYTVINCEDEDDQVFLKDDPLLADKLSEITDKTAQIIETTVVEAERNPSQVREEIRNILTNHQPAQITASAQEFLEQHQDSLLVWGDADQVDNATVGTIKAELSDLLGFEVLGIAQNWSTDISALSSSMLGGIKYDPKNPEHQVYRPTVSVRGAIEIHGETYDFRVRTPLEGDLIETTLTAIDVAKAYNFHTAYRASGMEGHATSVDSFRVCIDEDSEQVFVITHVTSTEQEKPFCMIEGTEYPVQVYAMRTPRRGGQTNYYLQHKLLVKDLRLKPHLDGFNEGFTIKNSKKEHIYPTNSSHEVKFEKRSLKST